MVVVLLLLLPICGRSAWRCSAVNYVTVTQPWQASSPGRDWSSLAKAIQAATCAY